MLIHVDVWQKLIQYCKAINLQLKKKEVSKYRKTDGKAGVSLRQVPLVKY